MNNDEIISTLNDLIETCKDGEDGFRTCAEDTGDPSLKSFFANRAQSCSASASTSPWSVSRGNSRVMRSIASACSPVSFSGKNSISRARAPPTIRFRNQGGPMSEVTPTVRNAVLNRASGVAKRKSQAVAQPSPAPAQPPSIAAMVTCGMVCSSVAA